MCSEIILSHDIYYKFTYLIELLPNRYNRHYNLVDVVNQTKDRRWKKVQIK